MESLSREGWEGDSLIQISGREGIKSLLAASGEKGLKSGAEDFRKKRMQEDEKSQSTLPPTPHETGPAAAAPQYRQKKKLKNQRPRT